ncbi:carbohydrate esterase family 12 protein [Mixia osmundae IAM 14324]|uniref:SGNH hydrolase-type esterase domain-containing protein n=1 Tax=Mixia osmundae (strain CBS 9802 / IAM 14324 / JCM 22182 / KY 12970) TaxID=764103 RepID=G7E6X0_MIXOS|nr:carbohydrate esterase family 12 protein [Mixia osmundae IAM 14324]KEI39037.1 carbohydrate esterase family 12 protein [Mixia osmundae IAM 14324]GAA98580.1 hypothetical protein E5Q_05267 [Mixia osmundae IAM 14324]
MAFFALFASIGMAQAATIYLAGDSLMAYNPHNLPIVGWGHPLENMVNYKIVNYAIGGASARSFTENGYFTQIANHIQEGDIMIAAFGINDEYVTDPQKGGSCPPELVGKSACVDSQGNKIKTYQEYMADATRTMIGKKALVILSSADPHNDIFKTPDTFHFVPSPFDVQGKAAAEETGAYWVDHGLAFAAYFKSIGPEATSDLFTPPKINLTHTNAQGAYQAALAFLRAMVCAKNPLASAMIKISEEEMTKYCTPDDVKEIGQDCPADISNAIIGWGHPFAELVNYKVENWAIHGASVRSFTGAGFFEQIADRITEGDIMIAAFGINDEHATDPQKGASCPPELVGKPACIDARGNAIKSYQGYMADAANMMIGKGAHVILSSADPRNDVFPTPTSFNFVPSPYDAQGKAAAEQTGAYWVEHGLATAAYYKSIGPVATTAFFPAYDHNITHTNAKGALEAALAFLRAMICANNPLIAAMMSVKVDALPKYCTPDDVKEIGQDSPAVFPPQNEIKSKAGMTNDRDRM